MPCIGRNWISIALLALIVLFWFGKAAYTPLVHPDEGRYAEIAREMFVSGDWTTPRLNGLKYFEKPPLQYWATAIAYHAFGVSEWSARLWTAFTGFGCVLATWLAGRRLFGPDAGRFGVALLLASPYFVIASGVNSLDMGVSCFLTLAVYAYLMLQSAGHDGSRRTWALIVWTAIALAVLSKGLIGVVLPLTTLACYVLWHRDFGGLKRLQWIPGLAVFFTITIPWFWQVSRANPEFLQFFFIHEHFDRFTSTVHHRAAPIWYFLPIVLFAFAPWVVACGRGLAGAWKDAPPHGQFSPTRFLLIWCVVVFVFFSVSQSKLPGYILPLVPALALLAGKALACERRFRSAFWIAVGALVFGVFTFGANEFIEVRTLQLLQERFETFNYWAEAASVGFIVAAAIGLYWIDRVSERHVIVALLLALYFIICLAVFGYRELAPTRSGIAIAAKINSLGGTNRTVFSVRMYDQTLPFYLGRTVILVDYVDEFELGIRTEPGKVVSSIDQFVAQWRNVSGAFAVMPIAIYELLVVQQVPMERILRERDRVLVRSP